MIEISGLVTRITYYNPENGYTVLRFEPAHTVSKDAVRSDGLITAIGYLPKVIEGEHLKLSGKWTNHLKHGLQFEISQIEQSVPTTIEGVEKYLASGLIHGVGAKLAKNIVGFFGADSLHIIESQPEQLMRVPDIGKKRAKLIQSSWQEQKQIKDVMIFLHGHDISTNLALKIYQQYQSDSLKIVKDNPYQLVRDVPGIRFITADKIARSFGLAIDHPTRIEEAILFVLEDKTHQGHVYFPRKRLLQEVIQLINLDIDLINEGIERLVNQEDIFLKTRIGDATDLGEAVYLRNYYFAEIGVANQIYVLNNAIPSALSDIPPIFTRLSTDLTDEQQGVVKNALTQPLSVITGGPGTGKTTTLKSLIQIVDQANKKFALVSPTGRAAKRLSEATGFPASTIHRLLEYSPAQGFGYHRENPLSYDLIVVDEASMLDIVLANQLLRSIKEGAHLVLVGDVDQLPSVGAGNFLRDVIDSGVVSVSKLTNIFRQNKGSEIIINSHLINSGQVPEFSADNQDFFRFPAETSQQAAEWVLDLVTNRIPNKFGFNTDEIQVMVPMYKGAAGINQLNSSLQEAINPPGKLKEEVSLFGKIFRVGDKVMQTKNNYDKQIFNGDIGKILNISSNDKETMILFGKKRVLLNFTELDQIIHAYAISVHKSQGAEFQVVILVLINEHFLMLQRNLLYTAVTRAKSLCVLVTNMQTLSIAVNNNKISQRYSGLKQELIYKSSN